MSSNTLTTTDRSFAYIRELVYSRAAIVLEPTKNYLVESRLTPLGREHGLNSIDELVTELRAKPGGALQKRVVEAMTTNETSFFRDSHPFEALKSKILPELIQKRAARKSLSIWCGAASTGQESYSVCMLLREHFPVLRDWTLRFVASDLSEQVLQRARDGIYNQCEVSRGLPAALMVKYFTKKGTQWQIDEGIRSMVRFFELNLIGTWPAMPAMDIIFLRNVLIYFSPEVKKQILGRLRSVLAPDGVLFLGGAETTLNLDDAFCRVQCDKTVYYQLGS